MKIPWGDLVLIGGIGVIAYFMKDTILSLLGKSGGTSDLPVCTQEMIMAGDPCRVASPFPYLSNVPVMPSGTEWISGLCMYLGIGCPEDYGKTTGPAPLPANCCLPNQWGTGPAFDCTPTGGWSGDYDEQPDGTWCKRV